MHVSPHADLRFEPFSRRGSYLNVVRLDETTSPPSKLRGIYLRHCHGRGFDHPIVAKLTLNGQDPISQWDEGKLVLRLPNGSGEAEIVFDGTEALRLRGSGVRFEMEFEPHLGASMYPAREGAWEVNVRHCRRKVLLRAQTGRLEALTDWQGETSSRMVGCFEGVEGEPWEGSFDFFVSTWIPRPTRSFAICEAEVREDFRQFLDRLPVCPPDLEEARVRAAYVNWSAIVRPSGHFRRPAMLMSKVFMSNVWSWDHAFNAMALMPGDPELAWDQMMLMADRQNEHGAFPDAQNDVHEHFNFLQAAHSWVGSFPLAGFPAGLFTPERIREAVSWLEPWTRWWLNHRLWETGGLPYYLHGNDSGWDNSTFFLQGVPLLTPDLPAFLILQCRELAELHEILGQSADAARWLGEADRLFGLLQKNLWNGDRYIARKLPGYEEITADTLIETIPLILGELLPGDIRTKVITRLRRYLTDYGLATEFPESPHYTPDGYWRGPIWAPSTMLLVDGLERCGERELSREISRRYTQLCAQSGFAENFNALSGAPLRDKAYTWTSSVFLILAAELATGEVCPG